MHEVTISKVHKGEKKGLTIASSYKLPSWATSPTKSAKVVPKILWAPWLTVVQMVVLLAMMSM